MMNNRLTLMDGEVPLILPSKVARERRGVPKIIPQQTTSYQAFMPLDQAGPATIARDNLKDGTFVAIKRVKRADRNPVYRTPDFTSEHVNILDMFLEGDEDIIIVYEQMDVSLRHIVAVVGGPLQAFEIAAVCKEVSSCIESVW